MSDASSAGSNGPIAPSAPPQAMPTRSRSAIQRTQERRRALIISGILLLAALTAVVVIVAETPMSVHSLTSPQTAMAMPNNNLRTAKITNDSDGKGCWQQIFDNQTGRMTRSQPCEATTYDGNGVPIPLGTIRRLNAISKSFSGH